MLKDLNSQQIQAVKHLTGPALVVAGPGSGKTRVLTYRIAYLIKEHNIDQQNILCVTFTNKAAAEIKERVEQLLAANDTPIKKLSWGGTFHSICAKLLRQHGPKIGIPHAFVIYDSDDQLKLIKEIFKTYNLNTKQINPKAVLATISNAKTELVTPQEYTNYAHGPFQKAVAKIYPAYQKQLRNNNALDFDDLLVETSNLFEKEENLLSYYQNKFEYILIDEYQDTNKAQYVIAKMLSDAHKNLFVVGDMSQAIYSFRGADYRNILNFQKDYANAKTYNLEQNYRSTQVILDAATNIIKNNSTHIHLDLWTNKKSGAKIVNYTGLNQDEEARFVAEKILDINKRGVSLNEVAVLYRTNAQSRTIEEKLIKNNIPYRIFGGFRFYSRKEVKDIISYLRVIHNPKDTVSWERIINVPPRGIGKKGVADIKERNWDLAEIDYKTGLPFLQWQSSKANLATIELLDEVIEATGYIKWLDDGSEENLARIENIKELRSVASTFIELEEFLENVALIESSDRAVDNEADSVSLMTIHSSKGLEFKAVFVVGMEEGLFPHSRSIMEKEELEEERRLCYVAITRAMEELFVTNAQSRLYFGRHESNLPSRFIDEIPKELVEQIGRQTVPKKIDKFVDDFLDDIELNRRNFSW